jgi:hypothetical protein
MVIASIQIQFRASESSRALIHSVEEDEEVSKVVEKMLPNNIKHLPALVLSICGTLWKRKDHYPSTMKVTCTLTLYLAILLFSTIACISLT